MKISEFKKVVKPLIKECIKEVILEEGILSNVVSEVAKGLSGNMVVESNQGKQAVTESHKSAALIEKEEELERQRQERIKKLNESARLNNTNVFEGTKQMPKEQTQGSALSGVSPNDPGVDISAIIGLAGDKWKHLV